MTTVSLISIYL